ncbi:leucyl aminopeptidase family protein [Roseomonas xinghualingensis]|uniref:leucyl aminopeptidase family protein n=1 Tax=Roseomonas xinghualingensis TaxID=2986475 RepID=UPI0021F22C46|nr:leucyl aminopeptidase family protein [Roseomonas sp. SXEYE001]MCV4208263.1 leucyl aminopeptidase family protein [Roseomonas sp. SXEYE001]
MLKLRLTGHPRNEHPLALPVRPGGFLPAAYAPAAAAAGFDPAKGEALRLDGALEGRTVWLIGVDSSHAQGLEAAGALAAASMAEAKQGVLDARGLTPPEIGALAMGAGMRAHRLPHYGAEPPAALRQLELLVDDPAAATPEIERVRAVLRGVGFARDLAAEPGNRLAPTKFADRLRRLEKYGIEVEVHGRHWLERHGYGGLLAVGQGSTYPPRLVVLRWPGHGEGHAAPVAFIGKGITFDTGGISIKHGPGMEAMKADMAGAAACAGAILALALRDSPAPALAVLAIAENATAADSYRPGDVLRMASGRTVEVVDTDAEGRLVLADALHHARGLKPRAMIDLATLTGSVVTALGHHRAGLFGNDPALRDAAMAAGDAVGEPLWPMPIGERHRTDLDSEIADLRHCLPAGGGGGGWAGKFLPDACHAAAFLREFASPEGQESIPWVHLDIAGMDLREEDGEAGPYPLPPGPSGFGVRLLDRLVSDRFEA